MALSNQVRSCAAAMVFVSFAASGCGGDPGEAIPARALSAADAGGGATLAADELLTITLDARLSTGFAWQVDEIDASMLRLASREHAPAAVPGGLDQEVLRFAGVGQGRTSLGLFYRRSWDPPGTGEQVYRVEVEVAGPYAGPVPKPVAAAAATAAAIVTAPAVQAVQAGTIPARYNACELDAGHPYARCTPVKDQGSCGSCWAFATTGVFENVVHLADPSQAPDLSEQYLVSCNSEGWSCDGGYVAFDYYIDRWKAPPEADAGAVHEADFPYTALDSACGSSSHPQHERATDWGWAGTGTVSPAERVALIQRAILDHGPVWVDVCADTAFQNWSPSRGVFVGSCSKINHGVVLVGWGVDGDKGYWIMRNSWGPHWGDNGYMRIAWGANSIASRAAFVYGAVGLNQRPRVDAGSVQTVTDGAAVVLDGSASDPDGSIQTYTWVQTAGPTVDLAGADTARPTFIAPAISSDTALGFRLTVRDDVGAESSAGTTVTVEAVKPRSTAGSGGVSGGCGTGDRTAGWALLALLLALPFRARARARPA